MLPGWKSSVLNVLDSDRIGFDSLFFEVTDETVACSGRDEVGDEETLGIVSICHEQLTSQGT